MWKFLPAGQSQQSCSQACEQEKEHTLAVWKAMVPFSYFYVSDGIVCIKPDAVRRHMERYRICLSKDDGLYDSHRNMSGDIHTKKCMVHDMPDGILINPYHKNTRICGCQYKISGRLHELRCMQPELSDPDSDSGSN